MKTSTRQTLRYLLQQMLKQKWLYAAMTISMILAVVFELIAPLYYMQIFDTIAAADGPSPAVMETLFRALLTILGIHVINDLFYRFNEFANNYFQTKAMKEIGDECFHSLNDRSYRFFTNQFTGSLVRKANKLVRAFEDFYDNIYWELTNLIIRIGGTIAIIWWFSPIMGIVLLVWMLIFVGGNYWASMWKYPAELEANQADSKLSAQMSDVMTNNVNVKLFTSRGFEQLSFRKITEKWRELNLKAWNRSSYINAFQSVFMIVLEISVLYLFIRSWEQGLVTAGFLILIQSYVLNLFTRIWDFGRVIRNIFRSVADAEEMVGILNTAPEVQNKPGAPDLKATQGEIVFDQVSFSYQKGKPVLKNFSLQIKPGEKIALVGHSGEGKSTITKLLMRFFDIQKGHIHYDGQNIADVKLQSLRESISLVPQSPILFHRSLAENIRYGKRNASMKEIIKVAKLANCHRFISRLKKGYQTFVGERGIKLSGGERQRVAIARAMLEDAPVVILDEATSSLDSHSEKLIQQALHRLLEGKTAIIIAHRLSTIMEADRILVIEDGKVVEEGKHNTLLRKKNGIYRRLWEIQAGGFIGE